MHAQYAAACAIMQTFSAIHNHTYTLQCDSLTHDRVENKIKTTTPRQAQTVVIGTMIDNSMKIRDMLRRAFRLIQYRASVIKLHDFPRKADYLQQILDDTSCLLVLPASMQAKQR